MKRLLLLCTVLGLFALSSSAAVYGPVRPVVDTEWDQEPVIIVDRAGETNHVVVAWMKWVIPENGARDADTDTIRINVSTFPATNDPDASINDPGQWTAPAVLSRFPAPNGYSGDPFLAIHPTNHTVYLAGLSRERRDPGYGTNEVSLWTGTRSGTAWSWNHSTVCERNANLFGQAWFTDKPSIAVSSTGVIYIAHMVLDLGMHCGPENERSRCASEIHLHKSVDGTAWDQVQIPLAGATRPQSPIALAGYAAGEIHVVFGDYDNHTLVVASSFNDGAAFTTETWQSPNGFFPPGGAIRGNPSGTIMGAASLLMARYNTKTSPPSIGIVWHEQQTATSSDVRFIRFDPDPNPNRTTPRFGSPVLVSGTEDGHQWNPGIHYDDTGQYLVTYYDSRNTVDANNQSLVNDVDYHLMATRLNPQGSRVADTPITQTQSTGSTYVMPGFPGPTLGEYQDVYYSAGSWYAASIGITPSGGVSQSDVSVAQIATPVAIATPSTQTILHGGTATIEAKVVPPPGNYSNYAFEWRKGAVPGDSSAPLAGTSRILTQSGMTASASFWCRVTLPDGTVLHTNVANVAVSCPSVAGVVNAWPGNGYVSRTEQPWVQTNAEGISYQWHERFPEETTPRDIVGYGKTAWASTHRELAYYSVTVRNECLAEGTLGEAAVHICVPTIDEPPQNRTVVGGTPATLSLAASPAMSGQPITIRWYAWEDPYEQNPLGLGSSFVTPPIPAGVTKTFYATVSAACGSVTRGVRSDYIFVNGCSKPGFSALTPSPQYVRSGVPITLAVTATGTNLTYQWYRGAPGTTTSPVAHDPAQSWITDTPGSTTTYWVRVFSESVCSIDSTGIVVDVCTDPVITTQPSSVTIRTGTSTTLSVASTTPGVTYQWYNASTADAIPGQTGTSLNVSPAADTGYYAKVKRGACEKKSSTATVTVCTGTASLIGGKSTRSQEWVTLTVSPSNSRVPAANAHYTWYRGTGTSATSFNSGTGMTQRAVNPSTTTEYWVRVNDGTCTFDSNVTTVNVCIPTITADPQGSSINRGQSAILSVSATAASTYQWYIGSPGDTSQPIGGNAASISVTPLVTTNYWVRVTGCTSVNSASATVNVCQPPAIAGGPYENGIRTYGAGGAVWISATGTGVTYQWYRGQSGDMTQPLTSCTTDRCEFTAQYSSYYWVRLTACGTGVNSTAVLHSVNPRITQNPVSTTVPPNGTTTLSVTATGTNLTYQWYRGNSGDQTNAMSGATSTSFTTPAITAATNFWCKVTSFQAVAYSSHATVGLCTGPDVRDFRAQYNGYNNWWMTVRLWSGDAGSMHYDYYAGIPGNVAQSVFKGTGNSWRNVLATQTETWWVRVWLPDRSCYTDTNGRTIYKVE